MALVQSSLIWVAYAVAVGLSLLVAATFVLSYQKPRDRSPGVTAVCVLALAALLATALLLPVDVALVSSTTSSRLGRRKDWATQAEVDSIVRSLTVVYYALYSLDLLLCLLVVPFAYFLHEGYDEVAAAEGRQTLGRRVWGAAKYTGAFAALAAVILVVGFFVPVTGPGDRNHRDLEYYKDLLAQNGFERALSFAVGLLVTLGTLAYALYTAAGLALLPVKLIRSAPGISLPTLAADTSSALAENRERQRQLEARAEGSAEGLGARDARELEALLREERTLTRRERLAAESSGADHALIKGWNKAGAFFRPLKLLGGLLVLVLSLVLAASMLLTGVDKATNSPCGARCGYVLGATSPLDLVVVRIPQPVNALLVACAKVFPIDYAVFALLVLLLFAGSVVGVAVLGVRFLWVSLFRIRRAGTSPQAMLVATELLMLLTLALNYATAMMVAPQYATFGPQTYCDRPARAGEQPDCSGGRGTVRPCSELAQAGAARDVCTPSVGSTVLNRVALDFPFFVVVVFWAQFAFLGVYLITTVTAFVRTPKLATDDLDADLEEAEEEGLLASTGRRFNASWQDVTGRAREANPAPAQQQRDYGTTSG